MKKLALSIVVLVLLVPIVAPALTADEIRLQIQSLLSQVEQLKEQLKNLQKEKEGEPTLPVAHVDAPMNCRVWYDGCNTCTRNSEDSELACTLRYCVWNAPAKCEAYFGNGEIKESPRVCSLPFIRSLAQGERGDQVEALQDFLKKEGFFTEETSGYFGSFTEQALKKWQAAQGVVSSGSPGVTGWGVLGPRTWQVIKNRCARPVDPVVNARFSASPENGDAPLTVSFSTWLSGFHPQGISHTIDFGDGSSEAAAFCNAPADACVSPGVNTHTYTRDGTYIATLNKVTDFCAGNSLCAAPVQTEVVGKILVEVGSQSVCTKEYRPVCGRPSGCANTCPEGAYCALLCQMPEPRTYGNSCVLKSEGAEYLYDGACKADNTNNKPPVISKFSGPTILSVGGTGMWSIVASDPENQTLSYSVIWGDEYARMTDAVGATTARAISQNTTFTHTYSKAGKYTVTITVMDSQGARAETSTTVVVGSLAEPIACTMEYAPVCATPYYCLISRFTEGSYPAECQYGKTYGNTCAMNAEKASFKHKGECAVSL